MPSKVFPKYVEWEDLWSGPISQRVECYKLYVSAVSEIIFPVSTAMLDTDVKSISVDKDLNYYTNPWW
jgi:hypothetical protein